MSEQEVHEIQLNGKQLVFMFMAATVVSVVIFLCGVMVGRGVRPPQVELAANSETPDDPTAQIDPTAPVDTSTPAPALNGDHSPAPVPEKLTYAKRLESPTPPDETLKAPPAVEKPPVAPAVVGKETAKPPVAQKASTAKPEPANASFAEPPGKGFVVQVTALPTRADAEALARRLRGKGYPTFISLTGGAAPAKYRVRVGKYNSKGDADAIFRRLQQEEHFKPWLTH